MRSETLEFENPDGLRLAARLDLPESDPAAWALFAHCFTFSKSFRAVSHVSRVVATQGIAVLRFDFTGLGASGGMLVLLSGGVLGLLGAWARTVTKACVTAAPTGRSTSKAMAALSSSTSLLT